MVSLQTCDVVEGSGIVGDRYALGCGFYSGVVEWDAHVTLMPIEPIEALVETHGVDIDPRVLRRNFLTRGIDPMMLIGRDFQVGTEVVLRGRKAWPPCSHIVKQSGRVEIFKYLARDTGIGADVVRGGAVRLGDTLTLL